MREQSGQNMCLDGVTGDRWREKKERREEKCGVGSLLLFLPLTNNSMANVIRTEFALLAER